MTEDDAMMKWCPFARLLAHTYSQDGQGRSFEGGYSYNRSPDEDEERAPYLPSGASCIGSACMAWRRVQVPNPDYRADLNHIWPPRWPPVPMYVADDKRGFCGLAGAPTD